MSKTKETQTSAPTEIKERTGEQLQGSEQSNVQPRHEVQQAQQQDEGRGAVQERRQGGLARYSRDPFEMMQRLSDEMDELFESFFHGRPLARSRGQSRLQNLWAPEVELREEGNQLRVQVDLPGVSKENVKVDVREGMLTIEGERREERTEGGEQQGLRRSERRYGSFYRSIPLPEGAQADKAEARMKEGVLEITVPITQKQTRRLEIQG
jgi:HSP20 family protein